MRVSIQNILRREDEQVVLECVEMTKDFEDIQEYALMKGNILVGYIHDAAYRLELDRILYFEAAAWTSAAGAQGDLRREPPYAGADAVLYFPDRR